MSGTDKSRTISAKSRKEPINVDCIRAWQRSRRLSDEKLAETLDVNERTVRRMFDSRSATRVLRGCIEERLQIPEEILLDVDTGNILKEVESGAVSELEFSARFDFLLDRGLEDMERRGFAHTNVYRAFTVLRRLAEDEGKRDDQAELGLWQYYLVRAKYLQAGAIANELFQRRMAGASEVNAYRCLGETLFYRGDFARASKRLRSAVREPRIARNKKNRGLNEIVAAFSHAALIWVVMGDKRRANFAFKAAQEAADHGGTRMDRVFARHFEACRFAFEGDRRKAGDAAMRTLAAIRVKTTNTSTLRGAIAAGDDAENIPTFESLARIIEVWARGTAGADSLPELLAAYADFRATGGRLASTLWLSLAADACHQANQTQLAIHFLGDALQHAELTEENFYLSEVHRRLAVVFHGQGNATQARSHFKKAIELAKYSGAKLFELNAIRDYLARFAKGTRDAQLNKRLNLLTQTNTHPRNPR